MTFCIQILEMQNQKNKLKIKGKVQYFLFTLIVTNSGFISSTFRAKYANKNKLGLGIPSIKLIRMTRQNFH